MKYLVAILFCVSANCVKGQGWYNAIPPVKVPTTQVKKARPVDVAGAWDAADKEGSARGYDIIRKLYDMKQKSLLFDFSNSKAVRYVGLVNEKYDAFIAGLTAKLKEDPAYFGGYNIEPEIFNKANRLLNPPFLLSATSEYQSMLDMEKKAIQNGTINSTASINGLPTDYTYKEIFQIYKFENTRVFDMVFGKWNQSGALMKDNDGYPVFR